MKLKIALLFILGFFVQIVMAQKAKRPQVLVYGDNLLAFAAAVQSAQSNVPTVWLREGQAPIPAFSQQGLNLDSLKQLSIVKGDRPSRLTKKKKGWVVYGKYKQLYNVHVVVDASAEQPLASLAGIGRQEGAGALRLLHEFPASAIRTLVASSSMADRLYGLTLSDLLRGENDGLFTMRAVLPLLQPDHSLVPMQEAVGQAFGATAAYLVFFKTSSDQIDVRKVQTELLAHGARILPFQDIAQQDSAYRALQQFALATVLPALHRNEPLVFDSDKHVYYAEVQPVFDRLYTRSQLWFLDHQGTAFTWKAFLSLVKYVGLRGDDIQQDIIANWSTLGFTGKFDPEAFVSRYQFAVILMRYASPYSKAVNQKGDFVF